MTVENKEKNLLQFANEIIEIWKTEQNDEQKFLEFSNLNLEEMSKLIDIFIEETENIKNINKLIRMKESIAVMYDMKIIYLNLRTIMSEN